MTCDACSTAHLHEVRSYNTGRGFVDLCDECAETVAELIKEQND